MKNLCDSCLHVDRCDTHKLHMQIVNVANDENVIECNGYALDPRDDSSRDIEIINDALRNILLDMKTGDCWCGVGINNPMMRGKHSEVCNRARDLMENVDEGKPLISEELW